jgi:hypothetical protein
VEKKKRTPLDSKPLRMLRSANILLQILGVLTPSDYKKRITARRSTTVQFESLPPFLKKICKQIQH